MDSTTTKTPRRRRQRDDDSFNNNTAASTTPTTPYFDALAPSNSPLDGYDTSMNNSISNVAVPNDSIRSVVDDIFDNVEAFELRELQRQHEEEEFAANEGCGDLAATCCDCPSLTSVFGCCCNQLVGSIANLCSATLGAGVLALPYAFYQAGLLMGFLLMVASAIATSASIDILVQAMDYCYTAQQQQQQQQPLLRHQTSSAGASSSDVARANTSMATAQTIPTITSIKYAISSTTLTYEQLTEQLLGTKTRKLVEITIILFCIGCAIAYIIAIHDIIELDDAGSSFFPKYTLFLVWGGIMVPLSMLKTMSSLQCSSAVGVASVGTLVLAAAFHLCWKHNHNNQSDNDNANNNEIHNMHDVLSILHQFLYPAQGIYSVLIACPIILFAFSCQVNVAAIYNELKLHHRDNYYNESHDEYDNGDDEEHHNNGVIANIVHTGIHQHLKTKSQRNMQTITWLSVLSCALLYTSVSIIAVLDFGKTVTPNLLSIYNPHSIMQVAFCGMAIAVIMAFPLNIFPARVSLQGLLMDYYYPQEEEDENSSNNNTNTQNDIRMIPNNDDNNDNSLEQPLLLATSDNNKDDEKMSCNENCNNSICKNSNATTATSAVNSNSMNTVALTPETTLSSSFAQQQQEQQQAQTTDSFLDEMPSTTVSTSWFLFLEHVGLTMFLTGTALGFALVAPNISTVFGLLGGTTSSVLGFIVPGCLGLQITNAKNNDNDNSNDNEYPRKKLRVYSWLLVVGGILVGLVTTGVTIYDTFSSNNNNNNDNNNNNSTSLYYDYDSY